MSKPEAPVEVLPIRPFTKPANARVRVPGSKSITNRALAIGALCKSNPHPRPDLSSFEVTKLQIRDPLWSRDTQIMYDALSSLGKNLQRHSKYGDEVVIDDLNDGKDGLFNVLNARLHVGNAGTAARFLTAILCLQPDGEFIVDGDEAMYRRPMKGLTDALESLGAQFTFHNTPGCIPFTLKTAKITKDYVEVNASKSSQILSALLIMAAGFERPFEVHLSGKTVSEPFVEMTVKMLRQFEVSVEEGQDGHFTITGPAKTCSSYFVEPDATAASYFASLPLAAGHGHTEIEELNYCDLQGDKAYLDVLNEVGVKIEKDWDYSDLEPEGGEPPDFIRSTLPSGVTPRGVAADFEAFSDTFLTLAALTPLLDGKTRISGIAHTRKQETDRVAAMACELRKLGQHVVEEEGALEVTPDLEAMKTLARKAREDAANGLGNASGCIEIDTYHDHRFAMSFAILGCRDLLGDGQPWLAIRDPKCCGKTFPNFFDVLEDAWKQSHLEGHRDACSGRFIADE